MATVTKTPASGARGRDVGKPSRAVAKSKIVVPGDKGVKIIEAVTIRKPAEELYAFWRNVENLPAVIHDPVSITGVSPIESHWSVRARAPDDRRLEWDALVINDEPGRLIAWRSREGSQIANAGSIRFEPAPGDEGTEVTVNLEYVPPVGALGAWIAKFSREEAGRQVGHVLRRFKALMEAGEIPTIEGQPTA